jgi:hypothetical protein
LAASLTGDDVVFHPLTRFPDGARPRSILIFSRR